MFIFRLFWSMYLYLLLQTVFYHHIKHKAINHQGANVPKGQPDHKNNVDHANTWPLKIGYLQKYKHRALIGGWRSRVRRNPNVASRRCLLCWHIGWALWTYLLSYQLSVINERPTDLIIETLDILLQRHVWVHIVRRLPARTAPGRVERRRTVQLAGTTAIIPLLLLIQGEKHQT